MATLPVGPSSPKVPMSQPAPMSKPVAVPSGPKTPAPNMSPAPNMTPKPTVPPKGTPVVVSTAKMANDHIQNLDQNIQGHVAAVNNQAANVKAATAPANQPPAPTTNAQGLTPQQMSQKSDEMMKANTIAASKANPGQLQVGGQYGNLQTGTGVTPQTFQAITNTGENQPMAGATTPQNGNAFAPTQASDTGVQGATSGTQGASSPQGTSGQQGTTAGGAQGEMSPDDQLASLNSQTDQAYNDYTSKVQSIQNGTFPLNPTQQATINSIMSNFAQLKQSQMTANQNYTQAISQAGITSGRSRYAPEIEAGNIQQAISQGVAKLSKIDNDASQALVQAQTAFQKEDYDQATSAYEMVEKHLASKTDQLTKMMDLSQKAAEAAQKQQMDMMKYADDQKQQSLMNTLKFAEFDQKSSQQAFDNIMTSDKFDYSQKQDAIKNLMDSDKFDYQQKQDAIKNALEQGKFNYQQKNDLLKYRLDLAKAKSADTPASYKEWQLSGRPGSYSSFLSKKADAKPPTQDQSQSASFAMRMKDSGDTITRLTQKFKDQGLFGQSVNAWTPNVLRSPDMQQMENAQRTFVNSILRKESGAAISPGEFDSAAKQYFPQPGDSDDVIADKARIRGLALQGITNEAGPALSDEFKRSALSNKPTYATSLDYLKDHPERAEEAKQLKAQNFSDADINDYLQGNIDSGDSGSEGGDGGGEPDFSSPYDNLDDGSGGFNSPLSTGKKGSKLGSLSASFESGGNPGAIGYDSTGGYSYGSYQLAHNNAQKFIQQSPYRKEFQGIPFNSAAFQQKWKQIAKQDPEGFAQAQHDFIGQTHYQPLANRLKKEGFDLEEHDPVLKDIVFSTAVQHGSGTDVVESALKKVGKNASDKDIIKAIYNERWNGGRRFASSTADVKRSVYNRFFGPQGEMKKALSRLS